MLWKRRETHTGIAPTVCLLICSCSLGVLDVGGLRIEKITSYRVVESQSRLTTQEVSD